MNFLKNIFGAKEAKTGHAISLQQGVAANALSIQALINVLVAKNLCTRQELLDELKKISGQNQHHARPGK
jgi:hypothetical protein